MRRAIASAFLLIAAEALDERPPVIIVTGLPHGGTTVTTYDKRINYDGA